MAGVGDRLGARLRHERGVALQVVRRDQSVAGAADEQCGHRDPVQPVLELGIVHVRLPRDQRERLAVACHDRDLFVGHRGNVGTVLGRIVEQELCQFLRRQREHVGNVEPVGRADLDPDRADHDQAPDPLRHLGGDFGRNPAADRAAHQVGSGDPKLVHQFEIDVGDVVDAVDPVGQGGFAETRMRGRDHVPLLCHQRQERIAGGDPLAAVKIKERRAVAAFEQLDRDARNRHCPALQHVFRFRHRAFAFVGWVRPARMALAPFVQAVTHHGTHRESAGGIAPRDRSFAPIPWRYPTLRPYDSVP